MTYKQRKKIERALGDALAFIKKLYMVALKCFAVICAGYYITSEVLDGNFLIPCILFFDFVFLIYTKSYEILDELEEDADKEWLE